MRTELPRILFLHLVSRIASAQVLKYTTSVVTTCYSEGAEPTPPPPPPLLLPYNFFCLMPLWPGGDCERCAQTSIYTTNFGVFCPTGTSQHPYTVTEVYSGMSSLPTFESSTCVPYGFTTAVHTCTVCGDDHVTATMTYPASSHPYGPGMPTPTDSSPNQGGNSGQGQKPGQNQQGSGVKPTGAGGGTPGKSPVTVSLAGSTIRDALAATGLFLLVPTLVGLWARL
ncbi:hypothetical protein GQ53DRAFT_815990 [Thozetella sp. PMI_491]|nr:hypothetical protein GQ53DRAFT_815990 [Thozetella sp. PMI_491]